MSFVITNDGQLDYNGLIITIHPEYHILPNYRKLEILTLLINWANNEIDLLDI